MWHLLWTTCFLPLLILAEKKLPNKEAYSRLKEDVSKIKNACGELCDQKIQGKPGKYFDILSKKVDCQALFSTPEIDQDSKFNQTLMRIPKWLKSDFTYQDRIDLTYKTFYEEEMAETGGFSKWFFEMATDNLDKGIFRGPYGKKATDELHDFMKKSFDFTDKIVLVVGSQSGWIELLSVRLGAKHVYAVDYADINSEHPQITGFNAKVFNSKFLDGTLPKFDFVISYSSIEHSGLGR